MTKGTVALAMLLALGAGLHANPDEAGNLRLYTGLQVANHTEHVRYVGPYSSFTDEFQETGDNALGLQANAGIFEWASLNADLALTGYTWHQKSYSDVPGPPSAFDSYADIRFKNYSLGSTLYPSAFWAGSFVPGIDSPDGKQLWPSIGIHYWRHLGEQFSRKNGSTTMTTDEQGYRLETVIPFATWFSLAASQELTTDTKMTALGQTAEFQNVSEFICVWASFFLSLRASDPDRVDDYFPRIGKPGQLRLDAGWGWKNDLWGGRPDIGRASFTAAYAWSNLLAFDFGYQLTVPAALPSNNPYSVGTYTADQTGYDHSILLGVRLNYGALPWAGRPKAYEPDAVPVDVKTDAPADVPEEPKEAPQP